MSLLVIEDGAIQIKPETRLIEEFKALIVRDRDRFKKRSMRELAYIYHMHDHKSDFAGYSLTERPSRIKKSLELEEDWKPDKTLKAAEAKFLELYESVAIKQLKTLQESLGTSSHLIDKIRSKIEELISSADIGIEDLNNATDLMEKILKLADKSPGAIKALRELEENVKKQESGSPKRRAGYSPTPFEK